MSRKRYECIGVCPLAFTDGQEVECGEVFERDFKNSSDPEQEHFLIQVGAIRVVTLVVPGPHAIQQAVQASRKGAR